MTKERLEELIRQGATIYPLSKWFDEISLNKIGDVEVRACYYGYELGFVTDQSYAIDIELLFETKEERNHIVELKEWKHKTHVARTERFEPPMWEDIKNKYCFGFCKNFGKYEEHYILDVSKNCDIDWAITVERDSDIIYSGTATKENYEKACEIVRDLFRGKNDRY